MDNFGRNTIHVVRIAHVVAVVGTPSTRQPARRTYGRFSLHDFLLLLFQSTPCHKAPPPLRLNICTAEEGIMVFSSTSSAFCTI